MKEELNKTKVFDGLIKEGGDDESGDLDIDMNLVSGIMKSFESQLGLTGPAGNLLSSLGIDLPENKD